MPAPDSAPSRSDRSLRAGIAAELALFRQPKVLLAAFALVFVPALYVLIYVSSVWDPYGHLAHLPVALVNEDVPVSHAGRVVNIGAELVATLHQQRPFAFIDYATPTAARAAVRTGAVFFAVSIPPDFSERVTAAVRPAQLGVYVSEGGNFTAAILSKRFATELAHTVNAKLARERWTQLVGDPARPDAPTLASGLAALQTGGARVAAGAARVQEGSGRLKDGLVQSAAGAETLESGLAQFAEGSTQLTRGMSQVKDAVTLIRGKLPERAKLDELTQGTGELARGALELKDGLGQLQQGVPRLAAGVGQLREGAAKVPLVGGKLVAGTTQLGAGVTELGQGIDRAAAGAGKLSDGLNQLNPAVRPLAAGLAELNTGLRTLAEKLPAPDQLDLIDRSMGQLREGSHTLATGNAELKNGSVQLAAGALELDQGARELAAGLNEAAAKFAAGFGGSRADRLAAPVEASVEVVAPVSSNGPAFAPYFSALSLWVGAVMMSFVFHLRRLPEAMAGASRPVRWLTKATPLLALGTLQATVVIVALGVVLGIPLAHPLHVWLVAVLGSVTFVSIVLLFMTLLGDAGRLLAIVLLIFQLAASGGIYPVELSAPLYQKAHAFLPFTHLLRSFRATMFAAFEGRWESSAGTLALFAVAAIFLGMLLARWKTVPPGNYGPAVEF